MTLPDINTIQNQDEARMLAIDWQNSFQDNNYSYGELADAGAYFDTLARKFNLVEEFSENGII